MAVSGGTLRVNQWEQVRSLSLEILAMRARTVSGSLVLMAALLSGCGTHPLPTSASEGPAAITAAPHALATAAPTIGLSRTAFGLCYPATIIPRGLRGYWCYPYASLSIVNTGGGTLNWTSTKSANWIKRSQTAGTAPSYIRVSVDGTGLPRGTYHGWIKVWASGATNNPQTVYVTMYR